MFILLVDQLHYSALCYIVQVVPRPKSKSTALAIATDPQENDFPINCFEIFWAQFEFFQDSRPVRIDHYISIAQQLKYNLKMLLVFKVDADAFLVPIQNILIDRYANLWGSCSRNEGNLCSLISKVQSAESTWHKSLEFYYLDPLHLDKSYFIWSKYRTSISIFSCNGFPQALN